MYCKTVLWFFFCPHFHRKTLRLLGRTGEETRLCENHLCSSSAVIGETALKFTAVTHANQKQSSCAKCCGSEQSDSTTITLQLCAGNNCLCDLAGIWVILGNGDALMFGFLTHMHPLWWDFFFSPKIAKTCFCFSSTAKQFFFFQTSAEHLWRVTSKDDDCSLPVSTNSLNILPSYECK